MIKEFPYDSVSRAIDSFAINEIKARKLKFDPKAPAYMQLSNYLSKVIKKKPRSVTTSKNFNVPNEHLIGYQNLVQRVESGEDINIYLSKSINNLMFSDRFLDDYGCVHFHLGEVLVGKYIERTGPVALAFVTDDEIFFIETKHHGKDPYTWSNKSVLEILHRERPHFISRNKVTTLKDISPKISNEEEIKNLRDEDIIAFAVTLDDGSVYMPAKFGPVTVRSSQKKKENEKEHSLSSLASEHMLRMMQCTKEIYIFVNRYIQKYKLQMNCTIMNVEIYNLRSDKHDPLLINEFDIRIYYRKGAFFKIHTNHINR
ncbi:hypothetical protein [Acinetobacter sp. BSP-28]|uniref:hypothetical protein n=1 Tax=Acinetobacter sp. BSP-28 TaxID=3344661 RepID=UPI00376F9D5B